MAAEYLVLGMMSGSSLDGLDLAICRLRLDPGAERLVPDWEILAAETDAYPPPWRARLRSAPALPGRELWRLHTDYGRWVGQRARAFLDRHPQYAPTLAGSHGHTVFHHPEAAFTTQIGDGAALANALGLPTVTELRGADLAHGGQGAPLAPLADLHLFPAHPAFLNLGGIANISVRQPDGTFSAGDVSGCCQVLDRLAERAGLAFDADGALARSGRIVPDFAAALDLPYHQQPYPKSLDNAWVREVLWPKIEKLPATPADLLHSFAHWLAQQIVHDLLLLGAAAGAGEGTRSKVLVTGGGARNSFLLDGLQQAAQDQQAPFSFEAPASMIGDFKEAALIALAALLRVEGLPNALASATGARLDTINGALYLPALSLPN
ncbi:anhydro-N-acetylmuramic acid kinase [Neolewinella lacunae]|uniref:Anhydro-N-acetylmuramic acid kinase n=1 Tax=Neolewinella lacunae TaxID=1517758 RepID=A0A923PPA5_9BACT|nr:anhydro-N-acetylmuramic acid kinase [Neolewinella lacunae]MBC6996381.1 anhydro-N-acetylmuramic acid kinase [Neolewinella lacunae]MDN3633676.1 anhydro-N-acetylmuramic acid kinase [Neolewinella lacunae]